MASSNFYTTQNHFIYHLWEACQTCSRLKEALPNSKLINLLVPRRKIHVYLFVTEETLNSNWKFGKDGPPNLTVYYCLFWRNKMKLFIKFSFVLYLERAIFRFSHSVCNFLEDRLSSFCSSFLYTVCSRYFIKY